MLKYNLLANRFFIITGNRFTCRAWTIPVHIYCRVQTIFIHTRREVIWLELLIATLIRITFPSHFQLSLLISLNSPTPFPYFCLHNILVEYSTFPLKTWYFFTLRIIYHFGPSIRAKVSFHFYFIRLISVSF